MTRATTTISKEVDVEGMGGEGYNYVNEDVEEEEEMVVVVVEEEEEEDEEEINN